MNIVTLDNITKVFTERRVFDETDFYLQEGEKVGVVGINGTGKSTLLRIIAGIEEADSGKRIIANHIKIKYLPQHPEYEAEDNIIDCIVKGCKTSSVNSHSTKEVNYVNRNDGRVNKSDEFINQSGESINDVFINQGNEYLNQNEDEQDIITRAKTMLTSLGIYDFDTKVATLSGGQIKRLALVETLLSDADVLLLDEPTNHLDQMMTSWLEQMLKKSGKTIVMVTHDRYFLDLICNRIIEVDKGKIYSYEENYSGFVALKAEREEMEMASDRKRRSFLRTELEWVKRGARARTTKQKFRLNRYEELKKIKDHDIDGRVELGSIATRMGRTTIELQNITKSFDGISYVNNFTYTFLKDDRIGIIGKNGSGKTTLLKIICGEIEPDSGTVTVGQTIKIGYYSQMIENAAVKMNEDEKVIDYIKDAAEYIQTEDGPISASRLLEKFLFISSMQYMPIGKLSGGEKRRLNLCRVLMEAPNVLILDEPTNDLDITTLTILEDFLDSFQGIVIIVSHDRYFLDRTVNRLFAFEGSTGNQSIRQFEGGYTDYENDLKERGLFGFSEDSREFMAGDNSLLNGSKSLEDKKASREEWKKLNQSNKKLKFSYQEQKDYDTIETEIAELEMRLQAIDEDMVKFSRDYPKLNELTKEKEELKSILDQKMERWMYLEELLEKINAQ